MTSLAFKMISAAALALAVSGLGAEARAEILKVKITDEITPATAEVVGSALARADRDGASVVIITLDTPGGLDSSMREIVSQILSSKIPVVVYVAPSGARAASAGFVILLAADVAAMSPGTVTGAAHPVIAGGADIGKTMGEKVENDAAAYVRSLAEKRGRDIAASESGVRQSSSFTEREALDKHLIEVIAGDESDLLSQLDGRSIARIDRARVTLHTAEDRVVEFRPTVRQRLLMWLADPRIAFLLFAIGALCIYAEFQHPGAILPGTVGAVSVVLALYGFHMLPINLTGVLLIIVALVLFVLEAKLQSFGLLGIGGIVAAVIGSLILIDVPNPEMRLPLNLVLAVVIPFGLIMTLMMRLAFRARKSKVSTGSQGMIGLRGKAQTAIAPEGTVFVRGELWRAHSKTRLESGEGVRVTGLRGLMLEVEPSGDEYEQAPAPGSADARSA